MAITNAQLLADLQALIASRITLDTQMRAWLSGHPTGGPNEDGKYPLTDPTTDVEYLVKCPAKLEDEIEGLAGSARVYATAAEAAAIAAANSLNSSQARESAADAARIAAAAAQSSAEAAYTAADNASINALAQAGVATQAAADAAQALADIEALLEP